MAIGTGIGGDMTNKVLLGSGPGADGDVRSVRANSSQRPRRLETDADGAADDLVKLVLALVETVRQLVERQAIRRVESGALSADDVERLGLTLLRLEERMSELKAHFGLDDGDLSLCLGAARELMDELTEDDVARVGR